MKVAESKKEARDIARGINANLRSRGIQREAYVVPVSQSFVKSLTVKGYPVPKRNYGVAVRNIRKVM